MKTLTFYDHRHGNVITVKQPKNRKDAWKKIWDKYRLKFWDESTFENINEMIESSEITEVDDSIVI